MPGSTCQRAFWMRCWTPERISKFGALRRQMQYVGRLMRDADADAIRSQLDVWKGTSVAETARLHAIERWRTRLIGDDLALGELLGQFPRADAQRLRALVRNVKREAAAKKPPKSFRELFQELREIIRTRRSLTQRPRRKNKRDRKESLCGDSLNWQLFL